MSTVLGRAFAPTLLLVVLTGLCHAAGAEILLPGDVRLEGRIESADAAFVRARVGDTVYELERDKLGGPALDLLPRTDRRDALIEALLPYLVSDDARVGRAARAALLALGPDAALLLEAARDRSRATDLRTTLDEIVGALRRAAADAAR